MTTPEDDRQPMYMRLQGKTQFEMAQSIDAAFTAAEQSIYPQSEQTALQWWYQQLETQVQEEFNLPESRLPKGDISTQSTFVQACIVLFSGIVAVNGTLHRTVATHVTMTALLERSLLDAIDMMRAQQIWRFDLQRMLQTIQGRLIHEFQHPQPGP
jgi:hypothetical protein